MRLYLRPINDATQFSDAGDYPSNPPFAAPDGYEWQEGRPPMAAAPGEKLSLNQAMERAFMAILPRHEAEPYCTPAVVAEVYRAKQSITDANRLGRPQDAVAILQAMALPDEMTADRDAFVEMLTGGN